MAALFALGWLLGAVVARPVKVEDRWRTAALAQSEADGERPVPDLERLFPDSNLQFPSVEGVGKSTYIATHDQMYPMRVDCWCHRYTTGPMKGLYNSKCSEELRKHYKWYYAHGVSTLRPQDVWLTDAKHYWVKEEECEYTNPWDYTIKKDECVSEGTEKCEPSTFSKPEHIRYCSVPEGATHQCFWDLQWSKEDPAYKLGQLNFECKRCPLYLDVRKKHEEIKDMMSFEELSLGLPSAT